MVPDLDIYRSANLLIDQHGEDAGLEAAMNADAMLENASSCDTEQDHTDDRDNPRKVGPATFTSITPGGTPYTH